MEGAREREGSRVRGVIDVEFGEGGAAQEGCAGGSRVGLGRNRTRIDARARRGGLLPPAVGHVARVKEEKSLQL